MKEGYNLMGSIWKLPSSWYWRAMLWPKGGKSDRDRVCWSSCSFTVSWIWHKCVFFLTLVDTWGF